MVETTEPKKLEYAMAVKCTECGKFGALAPDATLRRTGRVFDLA